MFCLQTAYCHIAHHYLALKKLCGYRKNTKSMEFFFDRDGIQIQCWSSTLEKQQKQSQVGKQ